MPVELRGTAFVPSGANLTTSCTATIDANVVAGDIIYVVATSRDHTSGTALATLTDNDTGGNTWTLKANSTDRKAYLFQKVATSGTAGKTVTFSGAVGSCSIVGKAFSGQLSGDPTTNAVVETNASGDETHTSFTPTNAASMLCTSIHNYANDNAVTALASGNFGSMDTTEKLSTGGNDCAVAFGHDLMTSGSTGNITWSQVNGTTYSIAWAIAPALVVTYTGTGALTTPKPTLSATAIFEEVFTGTGALTVGKTTLSASASHTTPTYAGTGTLTVGKATLAASAAHTTPTYTGTGALTTAKATLSANASTAQTFAATGALTTPKSTLSASASHVTPTYAGTGSLTTFKATLSGSATFTAPVYTGAAALQVSKALLTASATFTSPVWSATGSLTTPKAALIGSAVFAAPVYSATGVLTTSRTILSASANTVNPTYAGAGSLTVPKATLSASAQHASAIYLGVATLTTPKIALNAESSFIQGSVGLGTLTTAPVMLIASATFTGPTYTGIGNLVVPSPSVAGSAAFTVPVYTAVGTLVAPATQLSAVETPEAPATSGEVYNRVMDQFRTYEREQVLRTFGMDRYANRVHSRTDEDTYRVYARPLGMDLRVWEFDPMANMPTEKRYKTLTESATFGADFSKFGQVRGGEALSNPSVTFPTSPAGAPTISAISVNTQKFYDAQNGRDIPANKGVIARFSGGAPGEYPVLYKCNTSGGDSPEIPATLIVTDN